MHSEYSVIQATKVDELVRLVNDAIKDGWQPLGGVATSTAVRSHVPLITRWAQALVR